MSEASWIVVAFSVAMGLGIPAIWTSIQRRQVSEARLRDVRCRADFIVQSAPEVRTTLCLFRDSEGIAARLVVFPNRTVGLVEGEQVQVARLRMRLGKWARIWVTNGRVRVIPWRWVYMALEYGRHPVVAFREWRHRKDLWIA